MLRFFAGAAACFLLLTGAFLMWQSRAERALRACPPRPRQRMRRPSLFAHDAARRRPRRARRAARRSAFPAPTRTRTDGSSARSCSTPRRKAFAKLDTNGNGTLSFEEWAVKTIDKFDGADKDRSGWLTARRIRDHRPAAAEEQDMQLRAPSSCGRGLDADCRD